MKRTILFLTVCIMTNVCIAQSETDLTNAKLKEIQEQFLSLKSDIAYQDSIEFINTKYSILKAIQDGPKLEFDFTKVTDRIRVVGLMSKLNKANNPASDILGVSFVDVVTKAAETHFTKELPDREKPRFVDIVNKIIKNPIVSSVLNSNPVTSVVSSITNAAAGFFSTNVFGERVRELTVETKNLFDQKKLEAFNKELSPYISFYDNMIKTTDKYLIGVDQLKNKYSYLNDNVKNYNMSLLNSLNIKKGSSSPLSVQVDAEFKLTFDKYGFCEYQKVLKRDNVSSAKNIANNYKVIEIQVQNFKSDYNELLKNYLNETVVLLNGAKTITLSKGFSPDKIDDLINDIALFTGDLDNEKQKPKDNKFIKENFKSIRLDAFDK